jgi:pilus assembly protein CpaB
MNRNRMITGLATAVAIAFLFSVYMYRTIQRITNVRPAPMKQIVVADRPIQLGTRLEAANLRVISWPADEAIAGSFTRVEDCAGRAPLTNLAGNEPVLESKLAPKQAGAGLPATIPEGMRAVSVAVNEVNGVAGFVIPGTMVDILVTGRLSGKTAEPDNNITRVILENVRVLAAGQQVEQDREGKPQKVPVVTLLVTPEDATKLTMASTEGKIQLALRNTIDAKLTNPPPVLQSVLFNGPVAAPVAAPRHLNVSKATPVSPTPYTVEVITGSKKEIKTFDNE